MDYIALKTAALSDAHKENYTAFIDRYVEQAEAFIRSKLEAYGLEYTFTDADRPGGTSSPVYTLPARVTTVRVLSGPDFPLDQVDESMLALRKTSSLAEVFVVRPNTLVIAGTPGALSTFVMQYMGMPAPLASVSSNQLLTDYPQLYLESTKIYIYDRAQDYESRDKAETAAVKIIDDINRKIKKQLGGRRSSGPYNVTFRSSF